MSKVCIVGPSMKMGGMERASVNLANLLSNKGHEVVYISLFKQEKFFTLNNEVGFKEPPSFNIYNLNIIKTTFWLRKEITSIPDFIILVFNKFYSAITLISTLGLNRKIFISERSSPFYKWKFSMRAASNFCFYFIKPTGVIAQTKIAREVQLQYYGKSVPIKVIPNVLRDVQLYPGVVREKRILAVGRLNDPLKGFDRLIEAFSYLSNKDWELHFAGGEVDESNLYDLALKFGCADKVQFLGKIKEIDTVFAKASIFVIPSRSEGFPNALVEAMAAGLPCIAFDFIAGPRDLITNNNNGIIVKNGDISGLATAINELINDEKTRNKLGQNALKIRETLDKETVYKELISFLTNEK